MTRPLGGATIRFVPFLGWLFAWCCLASVATSNGGQDVRGTELLDELWVLAKSDAEAALERAREHQERAKTDGDERRALQALMGEGAAHYMAGRNSDCIAVYSRAVTSARALGDEVLEGKALLRIAIAHVSRGEHEPAQAFCERSRPLVEQANIARDLLSLENTFGMAAQYRGDLTDAIEHYFAALRIAEHNGIEETFAGLNMNIGSLKSYQGDHEGAVAAFERAVEGHRSTGNRGGLAYAYNSLGLGYTALERDRDAVKAYELGLDAAVETGEWPAQAMILRSLSALERVDGNYASGLEYARRSLDAERHVDNPNGEALSLCEAAECLLLLGHTERGLKRAQEASAIAEDLRIPELSRHVRNLLARAHTELEHFPEALESQAQFHALDREIRAKQHSPEALVTVLRREFERESQDRDEAVQSSRLWRDAALLASVGLLFVLVLVVRDARLKTYTHRALESHYEELQGMNGKLQQTLERVRSLSGVLPICAACKNIRDDRGTWRALETYISSHSEAQFTHGICPECADRLQGVSERTT